METSRSLRGQALVAIVNNVADWRHIRENLWYRVPVDTAPKRWPPAWLAFYQTKIFKDEAYAVRYYAQVEDIAEVSRNQLFPDEIHGKKSNRRYYRLKLRSLQPLPHPIPSFRQRRIVFIPTTLRKLETADEINDLYDDSPLEDAVWSELRRLSLTAERQWHIRPENTSYFLDFALFCNSGKLNVETDGDRWHADPARIPEDNRRNNALASDGWKVLRFNTMQIREEMAEYCVPQIVETVNQLGGVSPLTEAPRTYYPTQDGIVQQLSLFDRHSAYDVEAPPVFDEIED